MLNEFEENLKTTDKRFHKAILLAFLLASLIFIKLNCVNLDPSTGCIRVCQKDGRLWTGVAKKDGQISYQCECRKFNRRS